MASFWTACQENTLEQGDYLPNCWMPVIEPDFGPNGSPQEVTVESRDLIILTQSCDLANTKNILAALCPIHTLAAWEAINPAFAKKGAWESVRKGRQEGLHMLASPEHPEDNRQALVVDFREVVSLPVVYLQKRAEELGVRWRLEPPFREHFSQAFARFFMRVGLPAAIAPFK